MGAMLKGLVFWGVMFIAVTMLFLAQQADSSRGRFIGTVFALLLLFLCFAYAVFASILSLRSRSEGVTKDPEERKARQEKLLKKIAGIVLRKKQ